MSNCISCQPDIKSSSIVIIHYPVSGVSDFGQNNTPLVWLGISKKANIREPNLL